MSRLSFLAAISSRLKETKPALFPFVLPLRLPQRISPEGFLKRLEVLDRERLGLAESVHVCPHVIDPDALRVGLIALASGEKYDIGLHALRVEDPGRKSQDRMNVAKLHHPIPQPTAHTVFKQDVVGNHDGGAASGLERSNDVLNEGELLIRSVCRYREIGSGRPSSALLRAEGRICENEVGLADPFAVGRERVPALHHAFDAMEHEVHQAEPVCVGNKLDPNESVIPLKESLGFFQGIEIISLVLDVTIRRDEEASRAGCGVLDNFSRLGFHQANHAIDQGAWREVLPRTGLFLRCILLQQTFIEIAESFFPRRKPVELVDCSVSASRFVGFLSFV